MFTADVCPGSRPRGLRETSGMKKIDTPIGFIGAGRMATALARGLIDSGLAAARQIVASDPSAQSRERFATATGAETTESNRDVAEKTRVLFLAVKPQHMDAALASIRGRVGKEHLVVSIAAGVWLSTLRQELGEGPRLVRVMPNAPALVGQGAAGYCLGPGATEEDAALVEQMLGSVGMSFRVDERLLDAVTGLSGSGPAFVYVVIEAMSDAGVRMGLPRDVATALATQTVRGAAETVQASGEHPAALKDQVASPGGTTIAGLEALEAGGVRAGVMAAVVAATRRSIELGRET